MKKLVLLVSAVTLTAGLSAFADSPVLLKAMQDELQRSVEKLTLENEAKPYYISYQVRDSHSLVIEAESGALTRDDEDSSRSLTVDVRVGDYTLDNSHFRTMDGMMGRFGGMGRGGLTVDDDYDVLRRGLWLQTDRAYKNALGVLAKKKAYLEHAIRSESLPDFTRGAPLSSVKPAAVFEADRAELARAVEAFSRLFLKNDKIQRSQALLQTGVVNVYYVNSEGAVSVEPQVSSRLSITAVTQADDGMPLKNFRVYTFDSPKRMPSEAKIKEDVGQMIAELMALRSAPVAEDGSGPVLFEGQAAAEIIAQGFVGNLAGRRTSESDNAQFNMFSGKRENPFLSKVESAVIAKTVTVKATPSVKNLDGRALLGAYDVDDEGVKAQDVVLIDKGILKQFMMSRSPVKGFGQSNGHSREGGAAPSVIQVSSSAATPAAKLKEKLLEQIKDDGLPCGYIVRSIIPPSLAGPDEAADFEQMMMARMSASPTQLKLSKPLLVYRVLPDGTENLVRGLEFASVDVKSFKDMTAVADDRVIYDYPLSPASDLPFDMGFYGPPGSGGGRFVTLMTPSFIIKELDLNKSSGVYRKPPVAPYPALQLVENP